jgi:hypothetical protein
VGDRLTDLTEERPGKPEAREDSLCFAQLPQLATDSLEAVEEGLENALGRRRARERAHLFVRLGLEVYSLKINEKYSSSINLVDLADATRLPTEPAQGARGVGVLAKCLGAFANREKVGPWRDSMLTKTLKDSFNPNVPSRLFRAR